jgi:hypothetical protein
MPRQRMLFPEQASNKLAPKNRCFEDSEALSALIPSTTDLFMSGLHWIYQLSRKEDKIRFSQWAKLVRQARGKNQINLSQLEWLWDAIISEPSIRRLLLTRIFSLDDEWKEINPVECVPAPCRFGIFLKNLRVYGTPGVSVPAESKPDAIAVILEPLFMKPGKGRRLECCDVTTLLQIITEKSETKQTVAAKLNVDPKDVEILEGVIQVKVDSFNHAFTKATLYLQPQRRGSGGRVYDHLALEQENRKWKPLESIRLENEKRFRGELRCEDQGDFKGVGPATRGFQGLKAISLQDITERAGIYKILRPSLEPPSFLPRSPAGWFKGKDPTASQDDLQAKWVPGAQIIYIGKAGGESQDATLRSRIKALLDFGKRRPVAHWGGRYIWQLTDAADLIICWETCEAEDPSVVEKRLLADFKKKHGRLPFANLKL